MAEPTTPSASGAAPGAALLSISTSRAEGSGEPDLAMAALEEFAAASGFEIAATALVPDSVELISEQLRDWADDLGPALILTSGGTGLAGSDRTPEATIAVIEREVPGLAEAMRLASREHTQHWMLSRAVAGVRGSTLIINFPGSPKSIAETGDAIGPALPHAVELIRGGSGSTTH